MKKILLILSVFVTLITSCGSDSSTLGLMPESSGRCGEVLLVMPQRLMDGEIGDTVVKWLRQEFLVLPQYEPTLKVIYIKPNAYNDMFRKTRNVIICDVNPEHTRTEFRVESNRYASPQIYITLKAPSDSLFLKSWYNVEKYILDTIVSAEQQRFMYGFRKYRNSAAEEIMQKKHGVDMIVPTSGFNLDVDTTNFVWISKETQVSSQGILMFDYPYNGPQDFDMQNMIRRMDSVLMLNVPGPAPDSYMAIEKKLPPFKFERGRNGKYLCELRGLWEVEGDFLGGPFVSQSMVDTVNNRLVTLFSYVYGGKNDKKNLLWQLEAVMSTFNIHYDQSASQGKVREDNLPTVNK
ncbi:MAG: DUF4837 family protein [Bacteroidales bacterium]|nr:DUF4837 family protein [Bacteroidales bacterium]